MSVDLPEPGRAHDGRHPPRLDVERDAAKGLDGHGSGAVTANEAFGRDDDVLRRSGGYVVRKCNSGHGQCLSVGCTARVARKAGRPQSGIPPTDPPIFPGYGSGAAWRAAPPK